MMKHTGRMWTALGVALVFVLHVNADDVCPDTLSQGGGNTTSASFILHDSVGGVGGVSQTSASFQSDVGYIPQILSGCNCIPCDNFISQACDALQLNQQTNFADARTFLEAMFAGSNLYSVDICADGSDGSEGPQACAEFVLQFFQLDGGGGQPEPENNLPVIDNLTLTPSDPCDTPIVASVTVSDADMDAVTVSYQWLVNDVIVAGVTGSVLNSSNFVDDDIVKCAGTPHDGSDYGIAVSESVTVACSEPEPVAGFTITESAGSTVVAENGGTDTFDVVLDAQPVSDVVLTVASNSAADATVDKATLTFTTGNWDTGQTVTVTGVDDDFDRNDATTVTVGVNDGSSDDTFDAVADQDVAVTCTDDDDTYISIQSLTVSGLDITLTVNLSNAHHWHYFLDNGQVTMVFGNSTTFSVASPGTYNLTIYAVASDHSQLGDIVETTFVVGPEPEAGFTITESAGTTVVAENGGTDTFAVVLDAQPVSDVVLTVTSNSAADATVDKATLTFTTGNWDTGQTVTVTGVDDNFDRDDTTTVTVAVDDASSDDAFDAVADQDVAVTCTDDDTPENNLPVIDSLTLTPSEPCDTPITVSVTVSDADMDAVTVSYRWFVNDVAVAGVTGSVLNSSNFVDDDVVKCAGTPHDGSDYGAAVSESVTVVCPDTTEAAWKHQNMAWVFGSDQLSIRDPTLNNPQPASFSWSMVPAGVKSIYYPGGNDHNPQRYTKSFTDINATGLSTFDDYKNILDEAMSAWSDVSGIINLGYIEETQLNGEYVPVGGTDDIIARTSNPHVGHIRFMVFGDDVISGSVFASTTYIPDPSAGVNNAVNRSRSLDVRFRDTAFVWDDDTINPGNNVNGFFLKKIAMHEIGHALGFAHNSDSESVMGGGTYTYSGLGAADVAGAVAIYGQP